MRGLGYRSGSAAPPPTRRHEATSESNRARRFALPSLHDERAESSIQAFLDGPDVRRGRPALRASDGGASSSPIIPTSAEDTNAEGATSALPAPGSGGTTRSSGTTGPPRRSTDLRTLPGRLEWNAAMAREGARAARYHHPASIAIVELRHRDPKIDVAPFMRALAGPISRALREDTRATDLVARVATARFQLLLPETPEPGAERVAERLSTRCRAYLERTGAPIVVRVSVAGTGLQDSLQDALANAIRAVEAA